MYGIILVRFEEFGDERHAEYGAQKSDRGDGISARMDRFGDALFRIVRRRFKRKRFPKIVMGSFLRGKLTRKSNPGL